MKVILICPELFSKTIIGAIIKNNCEFLDYSYKTLPRNYVLKKIIGRISILFEIYSFLAFNKKLYTLLSDYHQKNNEFILIIRGHFLTKRNKIRLNELKLNNIITWTVDSIVRHKSQSAIFDYSRWIYLHDGGEISNDKEKWMPFGYNDELFTRGAGEKDIDILFVGNIYSNRYTNRLKYLFFLENSYLSKSCKCFYIGRISKLILKAKALLFLRNINNAGKLEMNKLADFIKRSKICINIQPDDGIMPVNPMFFAIPACGTCMVADHRRYFDKWLKEGSDYISVVPETVIDTIGSLLKNPARIEAVSEKGSESAKRNSFTNCLNRIINNYKASVKN